MATKLVSIHIRHCWRMNFAYKQQAYGAEKLCFNPHSPLLANELFAQTITGNAASLFQSTFAIAGE